MKRFNNQPCAVCAERFLPDSDIVVCPDCGSPYHRNCWPGECVNAQMHGSDKLWQPEKAKNGMECAICRHMNHPGEGICSECGAPLFITLPPSVDGDVIRIRFFDRCCGMDPAETIDDVTVSELADFVGYNTFHYLPRFKEMSKTGRKMWFNPVTFFIPDFYFANRKMPLLWLVACGVISVLTVPLMMMPEGAKFFDLLPSINIPVWAMILCLIIPFIFRLFAGLFGDWLYFRHAVKTIKAIKEAQTDKLEKIKRTGGVSFALTMLNIPVTFVFYMLAYYSAIAVFR